MGIKKKKSTKSMVNYVDRRKLITGGKNNKNVICKSDKFKIRKIMSWKIKFKFNLSTLQAEINDTW